MSAFQKLADAAKADSDYAWTLHCNIAMPIMDELHCSGKQANDAAARIMKHWFDIDVTTFPEWQTRQGAD